MYMLTLTGIRNYKVGVDAMRCFISLPIGIKSGKGIWNFGLLFNRMVVFSTTSESFHGQPEPISCPTNEYRRVFSAFYYASEKSEKIDSHPHFTKYNEKNNDLRASKENSPYAQQITDNYLKDVIR